MVTADIIAVSAGESPNERIARLEKALLQMPQAEYQLTHEFAPGVYIRTVAMAASRIAGAPMIVIGHEHKTEHFNIVHRGKCLVSMDGELHEVEAPCMFVSKPGVRKVLWIQEDTLWSTVHANPDDERDIAMLENRYVIKTDAWSKSREARETLEKEARKYELLQNP